MTPRASNEEYAKRVSLIREKAHLFTKRHDLVKFAQEQFCCSAVQARSYVRKALPDGLISPVDIKKDQEEASSLINHYLSAVTVYVSDEIEVNRMLRKKFEITKEAAQTYIEEFKAIKCTWGEKTHCWNKDARSEAYRQVNQRLTNKEWPKASVFRCTDCEARAEHYHHPNYAYPLWVEPVCQSCHTRIHIILGQRLLD